MFDSFQRNYGLMRCKSDPWIYYCRDKSLYIGIYVDDILIVGEPNAISFQIKSFGKTQSKRPWGSK